MSESTSTSDSTSSSESISTSESMSNSYSYSNTIPTNINGYGNLPKTGDKENIVLNSLGIGLLCSASLFSLRRSKNKKN
ncbi:LPXTG cell wall anchor domain-containing protein [Lactococcus garvieae]|nr:LPXTG cell wall anchor domain-containing protein [Lactococcus garvieae]